MLTEKTWQEVTTPDPRTGRCLIGNDNEEFRAACLSRLEDTEKFPTVQGIIYFENVTLDSSRLGEASILPYGPDNTIKNIEDVKADPMRFFLHDLPSMRQYPQWYITREAHMAWKNPPKPEPKSKEEIEEGYRRMAEMQRQTPPES